MKVNVKKALGPGFLALFTLLASCSEPVAQKKTPAAQAEEAVMVRHDSMMAQTGQLFELKEKVTKSKSPQAGPYLRGLQAADNAMMGWMHQYQAPDSTVSEAAKLAYFQKQQQILSVVDKQQRGIIDSVNMFLQQVSTSAK